ncbi:MAG TPA: hypothetical protein VL306_01035 [Methylomirabilota bacterium]|nr:hypothetical protein [Methylomirabilota bacterium]
MILYAGSKNLTRNRRIAMYVITAVVLLLDLCILFVMYRMVVTGRINIATNHDPGAISIHKRYAQTLAWGTAFLVLAIEVGLLIKGRSAHDAVFWTHLFFASVYLITLIALFRWTGSRSPYHAWIAYTNIISFLGVTGIGVPMMLSRF